ncbi:MAG: S8 family serine peptidase [Patescibacteria group bacterium]
MKKIVDAIAATIPAKAIEGLSRNPHVASIDLDDTVYATDAELDNSWGVKRIGAGTGDNVIYPAKFDSVIAVGAIDSTNKRASFSSTGPKVELVAPGVSVYSTWNDNTSYSTPQPKCNRSDGGCYKYGSGTSMASPHVAGVAALVIATGVRDTNLNRRINDEVRAIMNSTAQELGTASRDNQYGYGLVNVAAALAQ